MDKVSAISRPADLSRFPLSMTSICIVWQSRINDRNTSNQVKI